MAKIFKLTACLFIVLLLGFNYDAKAQAPSTELKFTYDNAGNQIKREFICINCTIPFLYTLVAKVPDESGNNENPKTSTKAQRTVTGYPNPLKETLNLKWDASEKYHITKIEAVSQNGLSVFKQEFGSDAYILTQITIPFQRQVPGTYLVMVTFSDSKQVVIKVVKI